MENKFDDEIDEDLDDVIDDIKEKIDDISDLGNVIDFPASFVTSGGRGEPNWNGVIQFGKIMIETDPVSYSEAI